MRRQHMHARKLMLTVLVGGPIAGILAGLAVNPQMQPPPEPSWRKIKPDVIFTGAGQQFIEAGPEDLDPSRPWTIRSALLARRFAADADVPPRIVAYRSDAEVMGDDAEYAAETAHDAAAAADAANLAANADSAAVDRNAAADAPPVDEQAQPEPVDGGVVL